MQCKDRAKELNSARRKKNIVEKVNSSSLLSTGTTEVPGMGFYSVCILQIVPFNPKHLGQRDEIIGTYQGKSRLN